MMMNLPLTSHRASCPESLRCRDGSRTKLLQASAAAIPSRPSNNTSSSNSHCAAAIGASILGFSYRTRLRSRCCCHQQRSDVHRRRLALLLLSIGCLPSQCSAEAQATTSASGRPRSAVVLLHGSGDSGKGFQRYLEAVDGGFLLQSLQQMGVETYFPDSGIRPYTPAGGLPMAVWYDRTNFPPSSPEATESVNASLERLLKLLQEIQASGIPAKQIAVGGFSMGGGIALQLALRHPESLGAAFCLSSYMCDDSAAFREMEASKLPASSRPPIFMAHGKADDFIRPEWGEATARRLQGLGVPLTFRKLQGIRHEMSREEIDMLREWLWNVMGFEKGSEAYDKNGDL